MVQNHPVEAMQKIYGTDFLLITDHHEDVFKLSVHSENNGFNSIHCFNDNCWDLCALFTLGLKTLKSISVCLGRLRIKDYPSHSRTADIV